MCYITSTLLTVYKTSRDTPASTEIKSLLSNFLPTLLSTIVSSASSNICGFTVRNTISQLLTTSLFFNVGWVPTSLQNPCVLSVRLETQTLSGFNIPVAEKYLERKIFSVSSIYNLPCSHILFYQCLLILISI